MHYSVITICMSDNYLSLCHTTYFTAGKSIQYYYVTLLYYIKINIKYKKIKYINKWLTFLFFLSIRQWCNWMLWGIPILSLYQFICKHLIVLWDVYTRSSVESNDIVTPVTSASLPHVIKNIFFLFCFAASASNVVPTVCNGREVVDSTTSSLWRLALLLPSIVNRVI